MYRVFQYCLPLFRCCNLQGVSYFLTVQLFALAYYADRAMNMGHLVFMFIPMKLSSKEGNDTLCAIIFSFFARCLAKLDKVFISNKNTKLQLSEEGQDKQRLKI